MSEQQQRIWVHAHVEESIRNAVLRVGGERGLHIVDTVEYLLKLGLTMYAQENGDKAHPFIQTQVDLIRSNEEQQLRRTLVHLTTVALRKQDEKELDRLRERCDQVEVSFEEIINEAQDDRNPLKRVEYSDSRLNKAELWLIEHMTPEEEYWATAITDEARAAGISASMIKSAKSSLGIRSVRRSDGWAWVLPSMTELPQVEPAADFTAF